MDDIYSVLWTVEERNIRRAERFCSDASGGTKYNYWFLGANPKISPLGNEDGSAQLFLMAW